MRRTHFAAWAPHCPVCARDRGLFPAVLLTDEREEEGDEVLSGRLVCAEPTCRHEFPIIDGIPVITATLRQLLGERAVELLRRDDLPDEVFSLIGDAMGPDSWFDALRQPLSTYGWDAYADLDPAEPALPPEGPVPGAARRCLAALLALAGPRAPATRVLDLGCGAGRTSFDLADADPGALVLGIESNFSLLRLARRVSVRGEASYERRRIGLAYDRRRFAADLPGRERVDFWACDAAALPFRPGCAGLVSALNLLDCVPDPVGLLHAMAALLGPGGHLLLATPFDWASRATPVEHWIGGHSQRGPGGGAAEPLLLSLLQPDGHPRSVPGLTVRGTGDAPWQTRLHDRSAVAYRTYLVATQRENITIEYGQMLVSG